MVPTQNRRALLPCLVGTWGGQRLEEKGPEGWTVRARQLAEGEDLCQVGWVLRPSVVTRTLGPQTIPLPPNPVNSRMAFSQPPKGPCWWTPPHAAGRSVPGWSPPPGVGRPEQWSLSGLVVTPLSACCSPGEGPGREGSPWNLLSLSQLELAGAPCAPLDGVCPLQGLPLLLGSPLPRDLIFPQDRIPSPSTGQRGWSSGTRA